MDDNMIPKADNSSDIIDENLLKNTYISKRQALRKNILPVKYRNNIEPATKQLKNEEANILADLKIVLQESKLEQDTRNQVEITKLYEEEILVASKRTYLRKILTDLKKEVRRVLKIDDVPKKLSDADSKDAESQKFINNAEKQLIQKTNTYNKILKELGDVRGTLDGLLKKQSIKNEMYDSMVNQLAEGVKHTTSIGKSAIHYQEKKEKVILDLAMFRDSNKIEAKHRDSDVYYAIDKLRSNLELNEYLQIKNSERRNDYNISIVKNIEKNVIIDDLSKSFKHLIHICGETDLEIISEILEKNSYDKISLFNLINFISFQMSELDHNIESNWNIGKQRRESIDNIQENNDILLRTLLTKSKNNKITIKSMEKTAKAASASYKRLTNDIHRLFKCFTVNPAYYGQLGLSDPPNEENVLNYCKEIEKQSNELLYKVTGIEFGCFSEPNDDPLMSDVESTHPLLSRDYNGIEIKLNKILINESDDSEVTTLQHNLDDAYFPPA